MSRINTKGAVAAACGLALLAGVGGGTFALWSDSDHLAGGTITAGNLDVAALANSEWHDISTATADSEPADPQHLIMNEQPAITKLADITAGKTIDLAAFKTVPGDTIAGVQGVDVALSGDNLKATLSVNDTGSTLGDLAADPNGVTFTTYVFDKDGALQTSGTGLTVTGLNLVGTNFVPSAAAGVTKGDAITVGSAALDGVADLKVAVVAHFDSATPDQVRVNTQAALDDLTVSLQQVRN